MNTIEIIIGVLGLIIAILIAMIPYFRRVYFIGPELTIEILPDGGISGNRGLSHKNDVSKGYVNRETAIYVFEVIWKMKLRITNNSNVIAYYPELKFLDHQLGFSTLEKLDKNTPIKENENIILKGKYSMYEESQGKDRTQIHGLPDHFKDLRMLLEYKNPSKKTFYTTYSNSNGEDKNRYTRRRPKEFKNNNR